MGVAFLQDASGFLTPNTSSSPANHIPLAALKKSLKNALKINHKLFSNLLCVVREHHDVAQFIPGLQQQILFLGVLQDLQSLLVGFSH